MHPSITRLPAYAAAVHALQALADATGSAWVMTNLPLDIEKAKLSAPVIVDPTQPCLFCNEIH
jgi:hypothetical protein